LDSEDKLMIKSVTEKSKDLFEIVGDCGSEYHK